MNSKSGTVELNDFCIPYREDKCEFWIKGPGVWKNDDTLIDQDISKRQASLIIVMSDHCI